MTQNQKRFLVPDYDCASTGGWVWVTASDPRYERAKAGGHISEEETCRHTGLTGLTELSRPPRRCPRCGEPIEE